MTKQNTPPLPSPAQVKIEDKAITYYAYFICLTVGAVAGFGLAVHYFTPVATDTTGWYPELTLNNCTAKYNLMHLEDAYKYAGVAVEEYINKTKLEQPVCPACPQMYCNCGNPELSEKSAYSYHGGFATNDTWWKNMTCAPGYDCG